MFRRSKEQLLIQEQEVKLHSIIRKVSNWLGQVIELRKGLVIFRLDEVRLG
jgi:hypothetical protein